MVRTRNVPMTSIYSRNPLLGAGTQGEGPYRADGLRAILDKAQTEQKGGGLGAEAPKMPLYHGSCGAPTADVQPPTFRAEDVSRTHY